MQALGLIEVIGFPTAIEAADSALKAANISLGGISRVGSGIVTVHFFGDVGAIKAAVEAGGRAAEKIGTVRTTHLIPRMDVSLIDKVVKTGVVEKKNDDENDDKKDSGNESGESDETNAEKDPLIESMTGSSNHIIKAETESKTESSQVARPQIIPVAFEELKSNQDKTDMKGSAEVAEHSAQNYKSDIITNISTTDSNTKQLSSSENKQYTDEMLKNKSNMELKKLLHSIKPNITMDQLKNIRKEELIRRIKE